MLASTKSHCSPDLTPIVIYRINRQSAGLDCVRTLSFLSSSHSRGLNCGVKCRARACPALLLREETAGRTISTFNAKPDGAAYITVDYSGMESDGKWVQCINCTQHDLNTEELFFWRRVGFVLILKLWVSFIPLIGKYYNTLNLMFYA